MKVFVTGATGFVGREVLAKLQAGGHEIHALVRSARGAGRAGAHLPAAVLAHPQNLLDPASLAPTLAGLDAVVHLVGIISEAGRNTFENVHTEGTRSLVTAAQRAGVKRFLHMSALGVRADAPARYHRTKWAAEEIVRASGLDWTIFRPSIIYGPGDQFVNLFARLANWSPLLPVMGNGTAKLQPIPVSDVATSFVRALTEPPAIGMAFDLCGPERLRFTEILKIILRVLGKRRWLLRIPMPVARQQAAILEFIWGRVLHRPPPLTRDQLLMLQEDNVGDPFPADRLFGLHPPTFRAGISCYLKPAS